MGVGIDKTGDQISCYVSSPGYPGRIALSDSEKFVALSDDLEAQVQPVMVPSVLAVIETVNVGPRSYFMTRASEPI